MKKEEILGLFKKTLLSHGYSVEQADVECAIFGNKIDLEVSESKSKNKNSQFLSKSLSDFDRVFKIFALQKATLQEDKWYIFVQKGGDLKLQQKYTAELKGFFEQNPDIFNINARAVFRREIAAGNYSLSHVDGEDKICHKIDPLLRNGAISEIEAGYAFAQMLINGQKMTIYKEMRGEEISSILSKSDFAASKYNANIMVFVEKALLKNLFKFLRGAPAEMDVELVGSQSEVDNAIIEQQTAPEIAPGIAVNPFLCDTVNDSIAEIGLDIKGFLAFARQNEGALSVLPSDYDTAVNASIYHKLIQGHRAILPEKEDYVCFSSIQDVKAKMGTINQRDVGLDKMAIFISFAIAFVFAKKDLDYAIELKTKLNSL